MSSAIKFCNRKNFNNFYFHFDITVFMAHKPLVPKV